LEKKYKVEFFEKSNGTYPAEEYIESLDIMDLQRKSKRHPHLK
jgi:hypothetical protein